MLSALVEDLPAATVGFLRRRARRTGAASVTEHVRHALITLARGREPVDQVVEFVRDHHPGPPRPVVDADALALARTTSVTSGRPPRAPDSGDASPAAARTPGGEYLGG